MSLNVKLVPFIRLNELSEALILHIFHSLPYLTLFLDHTWLPSPPPALPLVHASTVTELPVTRTPNQPSQNLVSCPPCSKEIKRIPGP